MAFVTTPWLETPAEEVARLAEAPVGSENHGLSQLPVTIVGELEGLMIQLPNTPRIDGTVSEHTIVVVPVSYHRPTAPTSGKHHRHGGSWTCVVVASDDPRYPVGGFQVVLPETRLVRGQRHEIAI